MTAATNQWIINRRSDLAFIFGGAIVSLSIPFIVLWKRELLPMLFWGWLFFFDGTHMWAAYSRTYIDRDYWKTDREILLKSLAVFIIPVAAIILMQLFHSIEPMNLFLLFAAGWSYYHIIRQHYGYVSLYDRKGNTPLRLHLVNKWTVYLGILLPYLYFIITHPVNRRIADLPPLDETGLLKTSVAAIAYISSTIIAGYFLISHILKWKNREESSKPAFFFVLACLILYSTIFYVIAPLEPIFTKARTPIQSFMLIQIMVTLFHNIQYHAIVWHYNRGKYKKEEYSRFGMATVFNRNFAIYALIGVAFSIGYIITAWYTTEYPTFYGGTIEPVLIPVAFCIWWGISFHHYYLDQKIWRVSKKRDLQQQLGVAV